MKIGLISTAFPHVQGGYRFIVDWLQEKLIDHGHGSRPLHPFCGEPDHISPKCRQFGLMQLDNYFERVITTRPPADMVLTPARRCGSFTTLGAFMISGILHIVPCAMTRPGGH